MKLLLINTVEDVVIDLSYAHRKAINGTGGESCGPTGFMNLFSENTNTIAQHARGATH